MAWAGTTSDACLWCVVCTFGSVMSCVGADGCCLALSRQHPATVPCVRSRLSCQQQVSRVPRVSHEPERLMPEHHACRAVYKHPHHARVTLLAAPPSAPAD
eukprot:365347-Chlamydomonas_euryale.AAC.17